MAAHDEGKSNPSRIPQFSNEEERFHYVKEKLAEKELTRDELTTLSSEKQHTLTWMERSIKSQEEIWNNYIKDKITEYPILATVTPENYQAVKTSLSGKIPELAWQAYEKAHTMAVEKKELELRPLPSIRAVTKDSHSSHEESYYASHQLHYLDHDPRYHEMVQEKVNVWNKANPDKKIAGPTLFSRPDGSVYIAPEVLSHLPQLEHEVHEEFKGKYADHYNIYMENERTRIYRDKDGNPFAEYDPRMKKLREDIAEKTASALTEEKEEYEKNIQAKIDAEMQRLQEERVETAKRTLEFPTKKLNREEIDLQIRQQNPFSLTDDDIRNKTERELLEAFIREHPEKAAEYAKSDPHLMAVYREVQEKVSRENAEKKRIQMQAAGLASASQSEEVIDIDPADIAAEKITYVSIPQSPSISYDMEGEAGESNSSGGFNIQNTAQNMQRTANNARRIASGAKNLMSKLRNLAQLGRAAGAVGGFIAANIWWILAVLLILFIIILIIVLIVIIMGGGSKGNATVSISKSVDKPEISNPPATPGAESDLTYTINVSYTGTAQGVIVTDHLSDDVDFVRAEGPGNPTFDPNTRTVTWNIPLGGGGSSGVGIPPNKDTCGGEYVLNSGPHDGNNFGDPSCDLAQSPKVSYTFQGRSWTVQQALIDLLNQLDPANTGYWIGIASCEAPGFDPNNVSVAVNGNAYGLFQMGASVNGPYQPGDGLNGPYDRGDVNWRTQVSNAVNYNKQIGNSWRYWECAKIVWGLW